MPSAESFPQNFTVALEASLLGQLFIFGTIFQPWGFSSDIPGAERSYLTIIPRARMGYELIAHEAEGRMGY